MRLLQSASIGNKKDHWDVGRSTGHVRRWACGFPVPWGQSAIASPRPPSRSQPMFSQQWRPGRWPPFCMPIRPRRRLTVQRRPTGAGGNLPACHLGADWPLYFPGHAPPCSPLPRPFCDVLGAPPPAMSIDQWGPRISHEQYRGPAGYRPSPPSCPHQRSNSDHVGKRYILGRNQESREIRELRLNPGNAISRELTSL